MTRCRSREARPDSRWRAIASAGPPPASIPPSWAPARSRPRARRWRRPAGRSKRPRSRRGQRGLRGPGHRGEQGHGLGHRRRSTSMAAPSPSATRSAPPAPAFSMTLLHEMSAARREEGPCHAVHRRRHGRRHVHRALSARTVSSLSLPTPAGDGSASGACHRRRHMHLARQMPTMNRHSRDHKGRLRMARSHWSPADRAASARRSRRL